MIRKLQTTHIFGCIGGFYETLFKKREQKIETEIRKKLCEEDLTEKHLYDSLTSKQNNKSTGSDGLTKELYQTFWNEMKAIFVDSVSETKEKGI